MTTTSAPARHAGAGSVARRLEALIRSAWSHYLARRLKRRTFTALSALSDRTLADIGLNRSEIESMDLAGGRDATRRRRQRAATPDRRTWGCAP